jgi:hypothetical protein
MRRVILLLGCIAMAVTAMGTTGCANVKPWERDVLARPDMAWDPDPQEAQLRDHIYWSKEASLPGGGAGGGGCGCN